MLETINSRKATYIDTNLLHYRYHSVAFVLNDTLVSLKLGSILALKIIFILNILMIKKMAEVLKDSNVKKAKQENDIPVKLINLLSASAALI